MRAPKDYIIFPLDVPSEAEARRLVELLADRVGMFKVGLELFVRSGPGIVRLVESAGAAGVFLDLKLHDIPATVERAMTGVAELGVRLVTVHCGESRRMLEAAVAGSGGRVGVLGITVLTSVSAADLGAAGFLAPSGEDLAGLVYRRAESARAAGCAGVVCSGWEAAGIKQAFGRDFLAVTPGIRPAWRAGDRDDQKRVMTPAEAVAAGADYLVIGRPIRDAPDPRAAALKIAEEIGSVVAPP